MAGNNFTTGTVKAGPTPKPTPYKHQPYPSWRYHESGRERLVQNADDEPAGEGWADMPWPVDPETVATTTSTPATPCAKCAALKIKGDKFAEDTFAELKLKDRHIKELQAAADKLVDENTGLATECKSLRALITQLGGKETAPAQPAKE